MTTNHVSQSTEGRDQSRNQSAAPAPWQDRARLGEVIDRDQSSTAEPAVLLWPTPLISRNLCSNLVIACPDSGPVTTWGKDDLTLNADAVDLPKSLFLARHYTAEPAVLL